ncbi:MAG: ThiF family adenylyltransferase [Bacteroidales bacterium]|nr:ThiF family adenylyltransferase [Bacteroidales bacterium]
MSNIPDGNGLSRGVSAPRVSPIFNRTELLVGGDAMSLLAQTRVIVFGVGGVGSWCAESLVRSGVGRLTVVDSDRVCVTNVNRQSMATSHTVGQVKVEALRERLLQIAPGASVEAVQEIYSPSTAHLFPLHEYDFVIDAIDSLANKMELIIRATDRSLPGRPVLLSSMGAALKMDPTQVRVGEFWQVDGCPLAAALRRRMRRAKRFPGRKVRCVWSPEVLPNRGQAHSCGTANCLCPKNKDASGRADLADHEWCTSKAQINGTMAHITAIMGFTLAGLVVQDVCRKAW